MGIFSKFEDRVEDTVEGAASRMSKAPISPVQIAKKAEKQMRRETMVGAGKQYAPTLYTVLVNPDDDNRLFGYYPTLAGETETYLSAKAAEEGLVMDGSPLVRFIVDDGLRHGKFEVIAEVVAAPIITELREEEMERYGIAARPKRASHSADWDDDAPRSRGRGDARRQEGRGRRQDVRGRGDAGANGYGEQSRARSQSGHAKPPLPYVPEDEIDRSIDYGEYTFNSEDFEDYRSTPGGEDAPMAYNDAYNEAYGDGYDDGYGDAYDDYVEPDAQPAVRQRQASTAAFAPGAAGMAAEQQVPDRTKVRACLIEIETGRPYDLAGTRVTLGRESGNSIVVQDINASRRHAELILNAQGLWVITDLRSMNGTIVNGVSVASQPLYPGDVVTIGKTEFEFALV